MPFKAVRELDGKTKKLFCVILWEEDYLLSGNGSVSLYTSRHNRT